MTYSNLLTLNVKRAMAETKKPRPENKYRLAELRRRRLSFVQMARKVMGQ